MNDNEKIIYEATPQYKSFLGSEKERYRRVSIESFLLNIHERAAFFARLACSVL